MFIKRINYCGINAEKLPEKFTGAPFTFIGSFSMNTNDMVTWNVYRAANPNRDMGHKDYMLLHLTSEGGWVSGRSTLEMEKERYQGALYCVKCDEVVYSLNRHDMHYCSCGKVAIDGGKAYGRILGSPGDYNLGRLDLLEYRFRINEVSDWIKLEVRDEKPKSDSVARRRRRPSGLSGKVQQAPKRKARNKSSPKLHAKKSRVVGNRK